MSRIELLKKLNKSLSPYKVDFSSIDSEITTLKKKMEETVNIQTVADVKYELEKFKKKIDLTSLKTSIESQIKNFQSSSLAQQEELKNQIEEKYRELDDFKNSIENSITALDSQQTDRLTTLESELTALQKTLTVKEGSIETITESLKQVTSSEKMVTESLQGLTENINSRFTKTDAKKAIQEILDTVEQNKSELLTRIGHLGGGSKPLRILNNGTDISKRYADVNLIGSGVTISAVDNHTTRQVDVTLTASGSSASFIDSEVVSFSGTSGTLANTPIAGSVKLYRGGARQQAGVLNDYTISGAAITLINAASVGEVFLADYRK